MKYVVDASVFNKLFLDESDKVLSVNFFRVCGQKKYEIFAPNLLKFEAYKTALHFGVPVEVPLGLIDTLSGIGFSLIEPGLSVWIEAQRIAQMGTTKSGYPYGEDSLYHALAIDLDAEFITADRRHLVKAKSFGHLCLLADWKG